MTKTYVVKLEGLTGELRVEVSSAGIPNIYRNDTLLEPLGKGRSKARFKYRIAIDGQEELLEFKTDLTMNYGLVWRGQKYMLDRPLKIWEIMLCLLPILVVIYGGIIGGAFGGAGYVILARRMRKIDSVGMKILLMFGVSVAVMLCTWIVGTLFTLLIR